MLALLRKRGDRAAMWKAEAQRLSREQDRAVMWKAEAQRLSQQLEAVTETYRRRLAEYVGREADPRALRQPRNGETRSLRPRPPNRSDAPARCAVSIVLGTYNRFELLKLAIESIRANGIERPYEIIVVDGGSSDGTLDWLMRQTDIISIVQHNRVGGKRRRNWGYFMNLAFKAAQGKYVLMLSDDCLLLEGSVERGLAHAESLEREGRPIGGVAFYFRDWPIDRAYHVQKTLGGMLMVNHGLFSKEALAAVDYAEEDAYSFYKADSDLALKLWHAGYEIVDCPTAFVEHFLLPEEELRIANNETLERDRQQLIARWHDIYVDRDFPDFYHSPARLEISHVDVHNTVAAFEPLCRNRWPAPVRDAPPAPHA